MRTLKLYNLCFIFTFAIVCLLLTESFILPPTAKTEIYDHLSFTLNRGYGHLSSYETCAIQIKSGKAIQLPDDVSVNIEENSPITVYYTYLLHRPLTIQYVEAKQNRKIKVGMLTGNRRTQIVMLVTIVLLIVWVFQWYYQRKDQPVLLLLSTLATISLLIFYLT